MVRNPATTSHFNGRAVHINLGAVGAIKDAFDTSPTPDADVFFTFDHAPFDIGFYRK
jgi:hypothetical protein